MDIVSIKKNLREKGLAATIGIFLERSEKRREDKKAVERISRVCDEFIRRTEPLTCNPSLISDDDMFSFFHSVTEDVAGHRDVLLKEVPGTVKKIESVLRKLDKNREYRDIIKSRFIKHLIPEVYDAFSKRPVKNRVIFMENGNSPSPSGYLLGKTLEEQGKYDVHYSGMKIRAVPWAEYYENALRFVKDLAQAKCLFLSTANDLLSHFDVRPETKVIQLWHGVGVFKKVGYSTVDNENFGKNLAERQEYDQYRNYDHVTIAAEEQSWIFEEAMRLPKEKIAPVGVARTDVFFNPEYIESTFTKLHEEYPLTEGKKIILYAPTFRGSTGNAKAPDRLDISCFAEKLKDEYVLLIKHHGLSKDVPPVPEEWKNSFAYDIGESKTLGIERLLAIADICITDYSSIAFEFAIMERPIIFFAYDLDEYIDQRGLYYDYDEITPGPVLRTNEEIVEYISDIDNRFDRAEIAAFRKKHVGACDGHAVEKTIRLMEE